MTRTQFQQCLSQLGISLTALEVEALIECFSDKQGVNYLAVLECVDPSVQEQNKYQLRLSMLTDKVSVVWLLYMYSCETTCMV